MYIYFFSVLIYLAMSDIFGLFDLSNYIKGEVYDYIVIILFILLGIRMLKRPINILNRKEKKYIFPFWILITFGFIKMIIFQTKGMQSIFQSISVFRELIYVFIIYVYISFNYNVKKIIELIIKLDVISSVIYIIEAFVGPLTGELHVSGQYIILGLYRSFSNVPLFEIFTISYLYYNILKREHVFNKKKDIIYISLVLIAVFMRFMRGQIFALIISIVYVYITYKQIKIGELLIKFYKIIIISTILIVIISILMPNISNRFVEGIIAIVNIKDNEYNSTLSVRTNTMKARYEYLEESGNLLTGVGPLHNDYSIIIGNIYDGANNGVIASDIAYGTILLRYGILGIIIYIYVFMNIFLKSRKSNNYLIKTVGIVSVSMLINGITSNGALCFFAILKISILLGIAFKSERNKNKCFNK